MPLKPIHYFTPDEVNALIPRLETHFQNFWGYRKNAQRILEEIRAKARSRKGGMDEEDLTPRETAFQQMRQSQAHFLLEQAKREIDELMELGCVVKDLEAGLLDFPHILESEEQEVYLCWKYAEKKVRYWHSIDQGYSSRKPLMRRVPHSHS